MDTSYNDLKNQNKEALEQREVFWKKAAETLVWTKRWVQVLDDSRSPFTNWFPGGELSLCYNSLDRHVKSVSADKPCFIGDSPVTNTRKVYTYAETLDEVSRLAGLLVSLGVKKGDVVMIYVPMICEGAIAMLACARIGAVHACVPPGSPASEVAARIDFAKPIVLMVASHGYHVHGWMDYKKEVDDAYQMCRQKPQKILVFQRSHMSAVPLIAGRDLDWRSEVVTAQPVDSVSLGYSDPGMIIFTSGTTGQPKAVIHSAVGFAVRWALDGAIHFSSKGHVMYATTGFSWIAGHNLIVYGPLINGTTSVVFEGDAELTKDPKVMYRLLQDNQVTLAMIRPGILKALKGMDPDGKVASEFDLQKLKDVYYAGERVDPLTAVWVTMTLQASAWNVYGQTESCCLIAGAWDSSIHRNSKVSQESSIPQPGWNICVLSEEGTMANSNQVGRIVARLPLPPGGLIGILNDEKTFLKYFTEFPGYYDTNDEGILDEHGFLKVLNRTDDQMKAGLGHITAPAVEEIVMKNDSIKECVVVSYPDLIYKEIPVIIFVKKTSSVKSREDIESEVHQSLRREMDPTIKFGHCLLVKELPITRTGKVHRPICRAMVRGHEIKEIRSVENPEVISDIIAQLKAYGYARDVLLE